MLTPEPVKLKFITFSSSSASFSTHRCNGFILKELKYPMGEEPAKKPSSMQIRNGAAWLWSALTVEKVLEGPLTHND